MNLLADWQWEGVATAVLALLILCGLIKWLNERKQHEINQTINEDIHNQQINKNTENAAIDIANVEKINQLEKELEESKEEAKLCLLQLHQVQEELEEQISKNTENVATDTLNAEKINQLEKELEESKEEAELCLLQLHQVQEELEHYFLLSQELQQNVDKATEIVDLIPDDKIEKISILRKRLAELIHRNNKKDRQIELLVSHQRNALSRASSALKRVRHKQIPLIDSKEEIAFL